MKTKLKVNLSTISLTVKSLSLTGYMGSGKSTVGKQLALQLSFLHLDLDSEIEVTTQLTISELVKSEGEHEFRKIESKTLKHVIQTNSNIPTIFSLGGGTLNYSNNLEFIKQHSILIYLKLPKATLFKRLSQESESSKRPLTPKTLEDLKTHFSKRQQYYENAHITIDCDNKTPEVIANEIIKSLSFSHPT